MTRADALKAYQDLSSRASENVRQLAFAALAVVWVFKPTSVSAQWPLPRQLVGVGALAITALLCDFLQYVYGTIAWGWFHRLKEKADIPLEGEVHAPRAINWPSSFFFFAKVGTLGASYGILLLFIVARLVLMPH